jgi:hypothetical protein
MIFQILSAFFIAIPAFSHTGPPLCEADLQNRPVLQTHFQPLTRQEIANIRLNLGKKDADYQMAFWFAKEFGEQLEELVFGERPRSEERVNVVVALGGAEPLSVFLRQVADMRGYKNFNVIDAYLTTKIMRPWTAVVRKKPDDVWAEDLKIATGIGSGPLDTVELFERSAGANTDEDIVEYLQQLEVYGKASRIVVVDTGFRGTAVEAVHYAGKQLRSNIPVSGALVHYNGKMICENTVPIHGLFHFGPTPRNAFAAIDWAYYMDDGHLPQDSKGGTFGFAFQRSSPSPKALIKDAHGRWTPDVDLFTEKKAILRHQAMALGFWDALHEARPEDEVPHQRTDK